MTTSVRLLMEGLARATPRRRLLGGAAGGLFAFLAGAATGQLDNGAVAGGNTVCIPPGPVCNCQYCRAGLCQKPCLLNTTWYASGCWVTGAVTCCDCTCPQPQGVCGCASDACP